MLITIHNYFLFTRKFRDYLFPKGVLNSREKPTPRGIYFLEDYEWGVDIPLEMGTGYFVMDDKFTVTPEKDQWGGHCVRGVQMRSYFWSVFSWALTEYRKMRVRNDSVSGNFS